LIAKAVPTRLPESAQNDLTRLMAEEARRYGLDALPERTS
jgi:hypothetical protein